jgi:hypothetical protein
LNHIGGSDFDALDRVAADALEWLGRDPEHLGAVSDSVSHWSPRMHLDHAALATASVCGAIRKILAGDARCVAPGPASDPLRAILESGAIPRGVADAPAAMKPPEDVSHVVACAHLAECRRHVAELATRVPEIEAATLRFPHFALGPMTAAEWVRFARIHFEHHVAIARDAASA